MDIVKDKDHLAQCRVRLDYSEVLLTEIFNDLNNYTHTINSKTIEQLSEVRRLLYDVSHSFAIEVEPDIQRTLHKCPLSFGLLEKVMSPNYLFNSPWAPKINKPHNTTTSDELSLVSIEQRPDSTSNEKNEQAPTPTTMGATRKRIKWTIEDRELFKKSLEKRGPKDLAGIAQDTNKTVAQVRSHLNSVRLEQRRSKPLTPIAP